MVELIRIAGDQPAQHPRLGFEHYARAIAGAIKGGQPAQFTIGLYGPWGSGKSSLLHAIGRELNAQPAECIVVEFDAWRYQPGGEMVSSLLAAIAQELRSRQKLRKLGERLFSYALAVLRGTKVTIGAQPSVEFDGEALADEFSPSQEISPLTMPTMVERLRSDAQVLGDSRVVVLIDDLDRCSPANLVAVLETINNVMDINGFVFVLALDYEVLVQAILREYPHVSGHEFIEKMVQVPFRVPPLDLEARNLLRDLLPNWSALVAMTSEGFETVLVDVVRIALRGNPRQTKRLVNSFQVLRHIVQDRGGAVDDALLVTVLGIQFGWPDDYARLQRILTLERPENVEKLVASFDEIEVSPISKLLRAVLSDSDSVTALTASIHLAAAAAPPTEATHADAVLQDFIGYLLDVGWEASMDEDHVWHPNDSIKEWHTVRIANRGGRISLEMREFSSTAKGRRPVFQTITHVPVAEAMSLATIAEELGSADGLRKWRANKLVERNSGAAPQRAAQPRRRRTTQ
ncbi:MAG: KAP family NTPase [Microbacterium sp.]|nr:KAP family NTPase [Microbacterium sp.]